MNRKTLKRITTTHGVAAQVCIETLIEWRNDKTKGMGTQVTRFYGFTYGTPGTVFMVVGDLETYVDTPQRFGTKFDETWVRNFHAPLEIDGN